MRIYFDTSFLMSLYSADVNSRAAALEMRRLPDEAVVSTLTELELLNAFELRVFRHEISVAEADASRKNFEADLGSGIYQLAAMTDAAWERARRLSRQTSARLGGRTADILHIAAALELGAERLYTFDRQQRKLARFVGLKLN